MVRRDIAINNDGYIVVDKGDIKRVSDSDQIRQHVIQRLRTYRSEWFLNTTVGVPYFEYIFTKKYNLSTVSSILRRIILLTPGVDRIEEFNVSVNFKSRTFKLFASIKGIVKPIEEELSIWHMV